MLLLLFCAWVELLEHEFPINIPNMIFKIIPWSANISFLASLITLKWHKNKGVPFTPMHKRTICNLILLPALKGRYYCPGTLWLPGCYLENAYIILNPVMPQNIVAIQFKVTQNAFEKTSIYCLGPQSQPQLEQNSEYTHTYFLPSVCFFQQSVDPLVVTGIDCQLLARAWCYGLTVWLAKVTDSFHV